MQALKMEDNAYTNGAFFEAFRLDLDKARGRVLIDSSFVTKRRVGFWAGSFKRLIARGVTVCAFIQEPRHWNNEAHSSEEVRRQLEETRGGITFLLNMGVHVTLRKSIHEKVAVIDEDVHWDGSLNILSHRDTSESMRRWTNVEWLRNAIDRHALDQCCVCLENYRSIGIVDSKLPVAERISAFTTRLVDQRCDSGLSQYDLAQRTRISQSQISRIEAGTISFPFDTLLKMSDALEMQPIIIPKYMLPSVALLLKRARRLRRARRTARRARRVRKARRLKEREE